MSKQSLGKESKLLLKDAVGIANNMEHGFAGSEHILLALVGKARKNSSAAGALYKNGFDEQLITDLIKTYDEDAAKASKSFLLRFSTEADQVLELAKEQADKLHHDTTDPEHILLAILLQKNCAANQLLTSAGADCDKMISDLMNTMGTQWPQAMTKPEQKEKAETKTLEQYSVDFTSIAAAGGFDPVIGRDKELKRAVQILSRRTKNNPVLIGEPRVGKTAIAEGLAQRISEGLAPNNLLNKRILSLDLSKMVSGTKYRGDFEERIKSYLDEAKAAGNVIIFIDELHTLIGAGATEGAMDASNILKPALGRGEVQVIGSTTLNEYKKYIEKDAAFERRFQPIMVNEPSREDTLLILKGIREKYEQFHDLKITDDALEAAVALSSRYVSDRYLPDKAIDLIDEAAASVKTDSITVPPHLRRMEKEIHQLQSKKQEAVGAQNYEDAARIRDRQKELRDRLDYQKNLWTSSKTHEIGAEDIASVVSLWTGVPVTMLTESESQRLMKLEDTLHKRVIGQDEAVSTVAKAIRRSRTGIRSPQRPIGAFLFLGPTGVGKTELSKALAEVMFQDENAIIRIDMSEYMEKYTVSKLIGSPPGYVGYEEGGQLTERVRRKPYSIVLFDEVEKAHPDVWNALLQIMDDGRLTDGQGRTVDFKNTIIIMTSNLGAKELASRKTLGFASSEEASDHQAGEEMKSGISKAVKETFQPEFLNRLDDIIIFNQLDKKVIHAITLKMLRELQDRSRQLGFTLEVDDKAVDILSEKGFDPLYGARPLQRVIQSTLEDAIAEKMLEGSLDHSALTVTGKDGKIEVTVKKETEKIPENVSPAKN